MISFKVVLTIEFSLSCAWLDGVLSMFQSQILVMNIHEHLMIE